jgi:hypothetical protein
MAKSKHQIGSKLHAQLLKSRNGELKLTYAKFRSRFGIPRRDTAALNRLRGLLASDCKVLVYPEVNGRFQQGSRAHQAFL